MAAVKSLDMSKFKKYRKSGISLAAQQTTKTAPPRGNFSVAPKSISRTRQDIKAYVQSLNVARNAEAPRWWPFQLLLNDIFMDAHLRSQVQNRINKSIAASFIFTDMAGNELEELTNLHQNATWVSNLNRYILQSIYWKHSLVEFKYEDGQFKCGLIPRTNIEPVNGLFFKDYHDDLSSFSYRDMPEYGSWIMEFGDPDDLGLLNNCVPHVLMKRFAQSCWSELCEIYGIPPRVMKTNTQDPAMLRQAERMMTDMGAAAWFIIDSSEEFEFAQGVSTNGEVYKNLIQLCNNEMSMVIQGGVIGQDTANGNRSKEEVSQGLLDDLVNSDLALLEQYWNTTVIPGLQKLGILPKNVVYGYPKAEDLDKLWSMTKDALQHYDISAEWVSDTFGIPVEPKKQAQQQNKPLSLNLNPDFFV